MKVESQRVLRYVLTLIGGIAIGYFICSFGSISNHSQPERFGNETKVRKPELLYVPQSRHRDKEAVQVKLPTYSWLLGKGPNGCAVGIYRMADKMDTITGVGVWQGGDKNDSSGTGVLGAKFYKESGRIKKINVDHNDATSWEWGFREDGTLKYRIKFDKNNVGIKQYYDGEGTPTKKEKVIVSHGS